MIKVTRLKGQTIVLNAQMIETIEETPDTVITMYTEKKYIVRESVEEVVERVIAYNRKIFAEKVRTSADTEKET